MSGDDVPRKMFGHCPYRHLNTEGKDASLGPVNFGVAGLVLNLLTADMHKKAGDSFRGQCFYNFFYIR